jgi:hypothetical protein
MRLTSHVRFWNGGRGSDSSLDRNNCVNTGKRCQRSAMIESITICPMVGGIPTLHDEWKNADLPPLRRLVIKAEKRGIGGEGGDPNAPYP